ncbi:MAG: hypothetical protein ABF449_02990 [Ethanoligenens sp.]|uniref:hypothetical protein n=1 Tax=Ethanoligenens sp. TaxID=2099655 RepID=UPI0039EB6FE6
MQKSGRVSRFFRRPGLLAGDASHTEGLYDVQNGWRAYILAGGTSGMKTALMQKIGAALEKAGEELETICNACDADCLDGLRVSGLRACVLDGVRFGGYSPACPGIGEHMVGMDDCLDVEVLAPHRAQVLLFHARQLAAEDRANRFLTAAGNLLTDNTRLALECLDLQKMDGSAARLAHRLFPQTHRKGVETVCSLTAVTPDGIENFCAQAAAQFSNVYILEDEYGVGKLLLSRLRDAALKAGQDVVSCPCALFPQDRPEHLLVPGLSVAFFTSCRFHPVEGYRHIHMRRFLNHEALGKGRTRAAFNRKAAKELIKQASLLLGEARESRNMVEEIYSAGIKGNVLDALAEHIATEMLDSGADRL